MDIKKIESEGEIYERLKLLGEGAFGKAYLVKQKATSNLCVIKQMNIAEMSQAEQNETFKEAKILQALNHPNIVKFKEVYVTMNKKLNIVMEYADGGDLSKRIKEQKSTGRLFQESIVLDWFTQMCLAIKHVHDRKIIHRDIKGQNIFVTKNNTLKLGDFGIARILNKTMEKARTVVGTPYYLSPEIIQNKPYSFKSDIWSMGVVLYQLCMLAPPFNAGSLQMLALKIVKGSYSPITGTYSKELKNLVGDMLNLDPNKRPSADQILKMPFIISRIQKFLTETQNKVEFSHTVLHDFKLGFNKDKKMVEVSRDNSKDRKEIDAKQAERERLLLKEKQAQMEKLREDKKRQERLMEEKRRKEEEVARLQRAAQAEEKKREEARRLQQKQEEYREKQQRMEYERYRAYEEQQRANKQKKREAEDKAKMEKERQEKKYLQFAKEEFFRNKAIKENAERRATQNYDTDIPVTSPPQVREPANLPKPNFHYKKEVERPQYKVEHREKLTADQPIRPQSRQKPRPKNLQVKLDDQMLMNAYMNPNFQKKQLSKHSSPTQDQKKQLQKPVAKKEEKRVESRRSDLKSAIEQGRLQMKQDREKGRKLQVQTDTSLQEHESSLPQSPHFKQSPTKETPNNPADQQKQSLENQSKQKLKTVRGGKWKKAESPSPSKQEEVEEIINENRILQEMINKEIEEEEESEQELNQIILELRKIVGNVVEQVEQLPSIHIEMSENRRKDDWVEPQKDSQFQEKPVYEKENLKYFSDYSKLEQLRMSLEDVFGTDTFVRLYRIIEKQFQVYGMEGLQHQKLRQKVSFINQNLFSQYITMLMTLIVIQNKVDEE